VQIEQREALDNLDGILAVPGLTSIVVGPNDLAASLGYTGQPNHPEVIQAIDTVIAKSRAAKVPMGIAVGDNKEALTEWVDKGVSWLSIAADFMLLIHAASHLAGHLRNHGRGQP
jgi:2-keto-3-deoxy-L-rhamnonate aldolase RhmA